MKVVISGQSGLGKTEFTDDLKKFIEKKGKDVAVFHIGMRLSEELKVPSHKILNLKPKVLELGRRVVFKEIFRELDKEKPENIIINTHNVFRWDGALFPAFNMDQLTEFKPDMYISLIDDIYTIYVRIKESYPDKDYNLKDLMIWREEEMMATEILAEIHGCPHFILARNYGPEIIYKLMFESHLPKVYTSFPITHIRTLPEVGKQVNKFRKWIAKHAIAFDPFCAIKEKGLHYELKKAYGNGRDKIKIKTLDKEVCFDVSEVAGIIKDIDGQIVFRDFKLIDQSNMVLAFYPLDDNKRPMLSSGVERELEYGRDHGKDVYMICESDDLSPFTRCKRVFKDFEEAKQLFKK
jgi:adenylate kinase